MAEFFLTRRATIDLIDIEAYSLRTWGGEQTDSYMTGLYQAFGDIARKPEIGLVRRDRSFPFYMAPAKQHFVIYQPVEAGIIIATILHGRRNIEAIVRNIASTLAHEIQHRKDKD